MKSYASNYAFRDKQDLLAMVNLQFAVEFLRLHDTLKGQEEIKGKLKEVDHLLDKMLADKG